MVFLCTHSTNIFHSQAIVLQAKIIFSLKLFKQKYRKWKMHELVQERSIIQWLFMALIKEEL